MNFRYSRQQSRKIFCALFFGVAASAGVLLWISWFSFDSFRTFKQVITYQRKLERLRATILQLDEALTMSARLGALTGNLAWEDRYMTLDLRLEEAIDEVGNLAPETLSGANGRAIDEANTQLQHIASQAFRLIHQRKLSRASTLLFSEQYESLKDKYSAALNRFSLNISLFLDSEIARQRLRTYAAQGFVAVLILVLGICWTLGLFALSHWRKLLDHQSELLEAEVRNRSRDLIESNARLRIEMEERRKAQEKVEKQQVALIQASKMAALGEMAGGIAHEINNPLSVFQISIDLLRKRIADNQLNAAEIAKTLERLEKTGWRIQKIIRGLRAFARETDYEPFESVSIRHLVEETLAFTAEKFHAHGIRLIQSEIAADLKLECRPTQISQVLLNLLSNAFDAVEQETERWVTLQVQAIGGEVEFSVSDSGPGIAVEIREKVFFPFFSTKPVGKGTGLGLSISKGLIEDHRGTFRLDTESARTRFYFRVPKSQQKGLSTRFEAKTGLPSTATRT